MSSPRKEQKDQTRARVRQAALDLFSTAGFDATTTKAVADRAGVATGTVFVHAKDKVDLLCLVMHDLLEEATREAFASVPKGSLLTQMLHVFGKVIGMYGRVPNLAAPFIKHLPGASGPNADRTNALTFEFLGALSAIIEDAKARGEVAADIESLGLARNLFALYFFSLMSWLGGFVSHAGIMPALEQAFVLQLRGIERPTRAG